MVDIAALEIKLQPQMQSSRQKIVTGCCFSSVLLGHTLIGPHPLPCLEVGTIHSGSDSIQEVLVADGLQCLTSRPDRRKGSLGTG